MRKVIVGAFVSLDGIMQAPGGLFADGSAPHAFKLIRSRVSSTGVLVGHYERAGEIEIVDGALGSPSKREIARQERMKREAQPASGPHHSHSIVAGGLPLTS